MLSWLTPATRESTGPTTCPCTRPCGTARPAPLTALVEREAVPVAVDAQKAERTSRQITLSSDFKFRIPTRDPGTCEFKRVERQHCRPDIQAFVRRDYKTTNRIAASACHCTRAPRQPSAVTRMWTENQNGIALARSAHSLCNESSKSREVRNDRNRV